MEGEKSKQEEIEDEKKWAMKYFDYAEDAIKEWISLQIKEEISIVFDDYKNSTDVITTEIDDIYYTLYLTPFPEKIENDTAFLIDKNLFQTLPKLQTAVSKLFHSVYVVYAPIIKTMTHMWHHFEDVFPEFNEDKFYFTFKMANGFKIKRDQLYQKIFKIQDQFKLIYDKTDTKFDELKKQLLDLQNETLNDLNKITDDIVEIQDKKCNAYNDSPLNNIAKLYIVLEKNKIQETEHIMRRLPDFGIKFQDPEEDNYIDKLKKEHDIN